MAEPALAQPVSAVSTAQAPGSIALAPAGGEVVGQFGAACRTLDRLASRFSRFPFVQRIFNSLRAAFGCISPG